jgi:hypothetical protein
VLAAKGGGLTDRQFTRLYAMIKPQAGEAPWAEIPWLTSVWEARKKAAAEGKPIFLWYAPDEPLGCTCKAAREDRAVFFVYPGVRQLIKEKFVAVARSTGPSSGDPDDAFLDKLHKQGARLGNSIGEMCTADGRWLGNGDVEKALAAWEKLPAATRKPGGVQIEDRGTFDPSKSVQPPPKGLILRTFIRALPRDGQGELQAPHKRSELFSGGKRYDILHEPNRDFVWLTGAEWQSLVPQHARSGDRVPVPRSVRDRILRFHLVNIDEGLSDPWAKEHIRSGELNLTVEEVSPKEVRLRLNGDAVLADRPTVAEATYAYEPHLLGFLTYNREDRAFRQFDVVALGTWTTRKSRVPVGIAFELVSGKAPAERVPPRGTRLVTGTSTSADDYFRDAPGSR